MPEPISIQQADADAQLHAESLALGLMEPTVWNHYWGRRIDDLTRRIDEHYDAAGQPVVAGGLGEGHGSDPSIDVSAPADSN